MIPRRRRRSMIGWTLVVAVVIVIVVVVTVVNGLSLGATVASTLAIATPLILAALGGLVSERSGVVNIGLEGMMLVGALTGFLVSAGTGSWIAALVAAAVAAGVVALLHAVVSLYFHADQIISGTAINLLGLFGTSYVFRAVYGISGQLPDVAEIPSFRLPWLGSTNLLTVVAVVAVPALAWFVFRSPRGVWLRAVGESPEAARTVGIRVIRLRYLAVAVSGMFAGVGGAYLSIGALGSFSENMTNGRGFIALAALIVGRWNPFGLAAACLLFSVASALGNGLQVAAGVNADLTSVLPYALTLLMFILFKGTGAAPAALGRRFE